MKKLVKHNWNVEDYMEHICVQTMVGQTCGDRSFEDVVGADELAELYKYVAYFLEYSHENNVDRYEIIVNATTAGVEYGMDKTQEESILPFSYRTQITYVPYYTELIWKSIDVKKKVIRFKTKGVSFMIIGRCGETEKSLFICYPWDGTTKCEIKAFKLYPD